MVMKLTDEEKESLLNQDTHDEKDIAPIEDVKHDGNGK